MVKRKKPNKVSILIAYLGAACRTQYLDENPHGYVKITKVHKNKKRYNRKQQKDSKINCYPFF